MDRGTAHGCQRADPVRGGWAGRGSGWIRLLPLAVLAALVIAAVASGAWRWLSLDALRDRREALQAFVHGHPVLSVEVYAGAYLLVVALSIPGALIMSLSGGYLFGAVQGALAALAGETAGAVIMYAVARSALGARLARGVRPPWAARLERGVRENAVSTLLALRLMPGVPFGLVNIAAGLLKVSFGVYLATLVIGIAPSTFIYCSIGSGLGRVFTRSGHIRAHELVTPGVVLPVAGLAVLALAPLAYKAWRARRGARPGGSADGSADRGADGDRAR